MPIVKVKGDILMSNAPFVVIPVDASGYLREGLDARVADVLNTCKTSVAPSSTIRNIYAWHSQNDPNFIACNTVVCATCCDCGVNYILLPTRNARQGMLSTPNLRSCLHALRVELDVLTRFYHASQRIVALPLHGDSFDAIESVLCGLDEWTIMVYPPK